MKKKCLSLGIELGSTRIKAVIVDESFKTLATGTSDWENEFENGYWTYDLDSVWKGIQLALEDIDNYHLLQQVSSMGVSAMMHGYLAFNAKNELLVPFRTWRNANTEEATIELSEMLKFNIPHRWSVAHLYQAVLNQEDHITDVHFITTLSGYVHWKLTGEKILGIGDASGMFPINAKTKNYDLEKIAIVNRMLAEKGFDKKIEEILPLSALAGEYGGFLTRKGAMLLDPEGNIAEGVLVSPPEGDAGTGMVATNSIEVKTGNVSVGTSVFAMIVLEQELKNVHPEIDIVTTPSGSLVAMVHVNNCTSDLNAWISLFKEVLVEFGLEVSNDSLYSKLLEKSLQSEEDDGGLLSYGYLSGENITKIPEGRPLFIRLPDADFSLANFMSSQINSAFATLSIGMNLLYQEGVAVKKLKAHGGIFKTDLVAQKALAAALKAPISISSTASEGGAWGMAVLASFAKNNKNNSLEKFLQKYVFKDEEIDTYTPTSIEIKNYNKYVEKYEEGLDIEKIAVAKFKKIKN